MVKLIEKIKNKIDNYLFNRKKKQCFTLTPKQEVKGRVLLSYVLDSFLYREDENPYRFHSSRWECWQIGQTFLNHGYIVDVIDWCNKDFVPKYDYDFFIDIHDNLERIAPLINKDCLKIFHITGSHWLFQNTAEYSRLLALQQRRGFSLIPRRIVTDTSLAIEYTDVATILGNDVTRSTYDFANKSIYKIPLSSTVSLPFDETKDYQACSHNFMWLGSGGMVHKGLDLVLEAFVQMPDYNLIICGAINREQDFEKAFFQELYKTPNIKTLGWVDVTSSKFAQVTKDCVGLIYPSCSEGQSGTVISCLHGGLIPIIGSRCGVDVESFGVVLQDCSISEIIHSVRKIGELSPQQLKEKSYQAWEYANKNHTREKFAQTYNEFVCDILLKCDGR